MLSDPTYLPQTQMATGWRWGNGSTYSRSFDADGRVTAVSLGSVQRSFSFDPAGRIVGQTDVRATGTQQSSYGYDELGHLISYTPPSGATVSYTYDAVGNRRSQGAAGYPSSTYNYAASTNRLTTVSNSTLSYQYGADGNPVSDGTNTFVYDYYGRLVAANAANYRVQYLYNGLGQLALRGVTLYTPCVISNVKSPGNGAAKSANAAPQAAAPASTCRPTWNITSLVRYMYDDQGHLLGEYDSVTGYQQETVWFNGQPVATVQNGNLYYVYADHLGTPRSVVRAADNMELWRWDSDPFGVGWPTNPNPGSGSVTYNLRFPGQLYDNITGLHSNGMRDYSPGTGRYIDADPIGLSGGLSRYTYVRANPLTSEDPDGTQATIFLGALAGFAYETVSELASGTSYRDLDWRAIGISTLEGAALGIVPALGGSAATSLSAGQTLLQGSVTAAVAAVGGVINGTLHPAPAQSTPSNAKSSQCPAPAGP